MKNLIKDKFELMLIAVTVLILIVGSVVVVLCLNFLITKISSALETPVSGVAAARFNLDDAKKILK